MSAGWSTELAQVDADLAEAMHTNRLAAFLSTDNVRSLWDTLSMGRRRAVLLHYVNVRPLGKRRRIVTMGDAKAKVTMGWREAEHRVSFATGETTHASKAPQSARESIASALSTS